MLVHTHMDTHTHTHTHTLTQRHTLFWKPRHSDGFFYQMEGVRAGFVRAFPHPNPSGGPQINNSLAIERGDCSSPIQNCCHVYPPLATGKKGFCMKVDFRARNLGLITEQRG